MMNYGTVYHNIWLIVTHGGKQGYISKITKQNSKYAKVNNSEPRHKDLVRIWCEKLNSPVLSEATRSGKEIPASLWNLEAVVPKSPLISERSDTPKFKYQDF